MNKIKQRGLRFMNFIGHEVFELKGEERERWDRWSKQLWFQILFWSYWLIVPPWIIWTITK